MASQTKISIQDLHLHYGDFEALKGITMEIPSHEITAFIGPSGCGKSTCIKTLNRMNDLIPNCRITGNVSIDGEDIYDPRTDVTLLRRRAGMVFQKPNPFPMSVYDNIAYGPRVHGIKSKKKLDELVERSLRGAALWDEVGDRLHKSALGLSGGQQQRLCIARALLKKPAILVLDDSTSAVDTKTDALIRKAFREEIPDTTKIIIAQRISSVQDADAILVLDDGRISGYGTHEQLLASNEIYHDIYISQAKGDNGHDEA